MSEPAPTPEELTALCREWQERLRLQDWRVRVRYAEKNEFPDGREGGTSIYLSTKQAVVVINPFARHVHGPADPVEPVLIHELLHLHFDGAFEKELEGAEHRIFEAGIDSTAWALYRAKYGDNVRDAFVKPCPPS